MKCSKCGCLVNEYYHSYKYNGLDYCCHCMLSVLVDDGVIEIASYNEEYKDYVRLWSLLNNKVFRSLLKN